MVVELSLVDPDDVDYLKDGYHSSDEEPLKEDKKRSEDEPKRKKMKSETPKHTVMKSEENTQDYVSDMWECPGCKKQIPVTAQLCGRYFCLNYSLVQNTYESQIMDSPIFENPSQIQIQEFEE